MRKCAPYMGSPVQVELMLFGYYLSRYIMVYLLVVLLVMCVTINSLNARRRKCVLGRPVGPSVVRASVHPLSSLVYDATSLYLVLGYRSNLAQISVMRVGTVEKVIRVKVKGECRDQTS